MCAIIAPKSNVSVRIVLYSLQQTIKPEQSFLVFLTVLPIRNSDPIWFIMKQPSTIQDTAIRVGQHSLNHESRLDRIFHSQP